MTRAAQILKRLEADPKTADNLPLFAATLEPAQEFGDDDVPAAPSRLVEILDDVDPDALTPREALDFVYRLKAETKKA